MRSWRCNPWCPRNINPMDTAVLSICTMNAGIAANQIPHEAVLRGTCRTHKAEVHAQVAEAIKRVVAGVAETFGVTGKVEVGPGAARGHQFRRRGTDGCHRGGAQRAAAAARRSAARRWPARISVPICCKLPGAFVWIGNGPSDGGRELHNPALRLQRRHLARGGPLSGRRGQNGTYLRFFQGSEVSAATGGRRVEAGHEFASDAGLTRAAAGQDSLARLHSQSHE